MTITNSTIDDIEEIFRLYRIATDFMKSRFTVYWPEFERSLVATEITEHRQWKMIIDGQVACVWAITFSDPQIWEERNSDPAIYIHRIATNPAFRGRNLVNTIVAWAKEYAKANHKKYVRLDTVGDNKSLITHYTSCGFNFLGLVSLKTIEGLPAHYGMGGVCLFELEVV